MFLQASYFFANRRGALALLNQQKKKKSVRFSEVDTVRYTHSPADYDRTSRNKRILRINTQLSSGPLFLTQLSTNYGKLCHDTDASLDFRA